MLRFLHFPFSTLYHNVHTPSETLQVRVCDFKFMVDDEDWEWAALRHRNMKEEEAKQKEEEESHSSWNFNFEDDYVDNEISCLILPPSCARHSNLIFHFSLPRFSENAFSIH